ncbi:unnamed protein product [Fraxinus pennsylvanica]|uniref:Uncharacterized protein n=1 Tax=Fraxinus pennsylvanica TaxID=56036 RepID=A0AAD2E420_9LAMI|nr:unnamed protein product [Fraxinus pennsylvanica]
MKPETLTLVLVNIAGIMERADESLLPGVYKEVGEALHTNPAGLGSLTLFRSIDQCICYPLATYLAVRHNRAHVIAYGAFLWAAATFVVAFSSTFFQVALSRALNGNGLAIVTPAIQSLVADSTDNSSRVRIFANDPHFPEGGVRTSNEVHHRSLLEEVKVLVHEAKSVINIQSFQIIVAQDVTVANSLGGLFLSKRLPNSGRIILSQISSASAIPLTAILFLSLPTDPSTMFLHGFILLIAASPIFAEILPEKSRTSIYALDRSFESVLSSFASPIVGLLAQVAIDMHYDNDGLDLYDDDDEKTLVSQRLKFSNGGKTE